MLAWTYYLVLMVLLVLSLSLLYKVALPNRLPWRRGLPGALLGVVVFIIATAGLRLYISWVTNTGYTYGALAGADRDPARHVLLRDGCRHRSAAEQRNQGTVARTRK